MNQHLFPRFTHRALLAVVLAATAGVAFAAPQPAGVCDADAASCLEQMSLVLTQRDTGGASSEAPKPQSRLRTVRSGPGPVAPRLSMDKSLSPEITN
jgi:hypothetical protein